MNTDVSGGTGDGSTIENAYSSLQAAYTASAGSLSEDINFLCYATASTADSNVVMNGITPGSYNINVTGMDANYKIECTDTTAIDISDENVKLKSIKIYGTVTSIGMGIYVHDVGTCTLTIDSCYIKGICSGSGGANGIKVEDSSVTTTIYSSIIHGWKSGADSGFTGILQGSSGSTYVYNSVIEGCYYGLQEPLGHIYAANCVVFNNNDDFKSFTDPNTIDYCASDDGDGTNAINWANEATDWNANFTDYSNGDFTVKDSNADIYHSGIDLGLSTDYSGYAWYTTPSIGAFEYVAISAAIPVRRPRIININMN